MKVGNTLKKQYLAIGIVIIAVVGRLVPHYPNFTPMEAIAMFSGAFIASRWLSIILPLASLWIADIILNNTIYRHFYHGEDNIIWFSEYMIWTGLSIVGIVIIGSYLKTRLKPVSIGIGAISGSTLFFVLSNFGVWTSSVMYPKSLAGLFECYAMALPFWINSAISTVVFSIILFLGYKWLTQKFLAPKSI